MSFCFLYNVVSENHSVQKLPGGGGGRGVYSQLKVYKLRWVFRFSYLYYLINPGKIAHSDAATLPPISH